VQDRAAELSVEFVKECHGLPVDLFDDMFGRENGDDAIYVLNQFLCVGKVVQWRAFEQDKVIFADERPEVLQEVFAWQYLRWGIVAAFGADGEDGVPDLFGGSFYLANDGLVIARVYLFQDGVRVQLEGEVGIAEIGIDDQYLLFAHAEAIGEGLDEGRLAFAFFGAGEEEYLFAAVLYLEAELAERFPELVVSFVIGSVGARFAAGDDLGEILLPQVHEIDHADHFQAHGLGEDDGRLDRCIEIGEQYDDEDGDDERRRAAHAYDEHSFGGFGIDGGLSADDEPEIIDRRGGDIEGVVVFLFGGQIVFIGEICVFDERLERGGFTRVFCDVALDLVHLILHGADVIGAGP